MPAALAAVFSLVTLAWAIDTSGSDVSRGVQLAGRSIGGTSLGEVPDRVASAAEAFATTPTEIVTPSTRYRTTAGEIGIAVDRRATVDAVAATEDRGVLPLRPLRWLARLSDDRDVPLRFAVDRTTLASTVEALEGDDRVPPREPGVELVDGHFRVVPGQDGTGIDEATLVRKLAEAATAGERPLRVEVSPTAIPPRGSDADAEAAAARAEELLASPLEVRTPGGARTITSQDLRGWATLSSTEEGSVEVAFDQARVDATLRERFADIEGAPRNARITLDAGRPVIEGDAPGRVCCGAGSGAQILDALRAGRASIDLPLVVGPASFTAADAAAWRVTQPVGGSNAWRGGAPTTAGPGFTTYHACCGARVANIHRMADLVRGALVGPGQSFSINDHVGRRTTDKGFVAAGAIRDGHHVDEIGGGVSQFATTMFNAAYFAGLRIDRYQAHSEYFDRYPLGREATMGYPAPDLRFTNDTPYGILIWTSYTDTSLTITLYSSPWATAEQTGLRESRSGNCRVVVTTRTRTFPDGRRAEDTFRATYRPGEGQSC